MRQRPKPQAPDTVMTRRLIPLLHPFSPENSRYPIYSHSRRQFPPFLLHLQH